MNASFNFTFESQFDIFRQFCQKFSDSCTYHVYHCSELKVEVFLQEDIRGKYASLWNDFVSIQINLLNGKLRQLFENRLNVNLNKLNQFYKYFNCSRILSMALPNNGDDDKNVPRLYDFNVWVEMMEKFGGDNYNGSRTRTIQAHLEKNWKCLIFIHLLCYGMVYFVSCINGIQIINVDC